MVPLWWTQLTWFAEYILYQATLRRRIIVVGFCLALMVGGLGTLQSQHRRASHAHPPTLFSDPSQVKTAALQRLLSVPVTALLQTLAKQASAYGLLHVQTQYSYHRIHSTLQTVEIEMGYSANPLVSQRFIINTLALFPSALLVEVHMQRKKSPRYNTAEIHTAVHFRVLTQ